MPLSAMYENHQQGLLTRAQFARRVAANLGVASLAIGISLGIGILGYHHWAGLGWIDSLLNASMILGGMGPADNLHSNGAKVFASVYALFSGLVFIALLGFLLAPFIHRLMHHFHIADEDENKKKEK